VQLQHDHQQFILIADLQGLTDNGSNPQKISSNILEVMADYLAVGIDPQKTTICLQSALPALAELSALYMNIVTVARVERNPTVKNEIAQKGFSRSLPVGPIPLARRPISPPLRPNWYRSATISYR
jgi:tryptophanyl-tRNA synthetase